MQIPIHAQLDTTENQPAAASAEVATAPELARPKLTISGKLALMLVGLFLVIMVQLAMLSASIKISDGARSYVSGENLWSKAQKNAIYHLVNFVYTGSPSALNHFHKNVATTLSIREARLELERPEYSRSKVEENFIGAGIAKADVPGLVLLFRHFGDISYMANAIQLWREADGGIDELIALCAQIEAARLQGPFDADLQAHFLLQLSELNDRLNTLELEFSSTLDYAARWTSWAVIVAIVSVTSVLLAIGLWLWFWLSTGIRKGVEELCLAAEHVASGDLDFRIQNISKDELGSLALSFNNMVANRSMVETDLENERRFLQAVLENLSEAVIACDAQGRLSLFNRSAKTLHGIDEDQPPPLAWSGQHGELFHADATTPLSDEEDPLLRALTGESVKDKEVVIAPYNHESRSALANSQALTNSDGTILGALVTLHDITERVCAEKAMEQHAEKLAKANEELQHSNLELRRLYQAEAASEAKSRFVATMSHEIRTPLHCIVGLIEVFDEENLNDTQRRNLRLMNESSHALMQLVNNVLDFAKIEAGLMELENREFDVRALAQSLCDTLKQDARRESVELSFEIDAEVPPILSGDATRLRQILLNLMNNALKFTPAQGQVAMLVSRPGASNVEFSVSDTGIGMGQDTCAKVFDSFVQADVSTTRRYGGSGLGLSICKTLVEQMGGSIGCESSPGVGSRFYFELPLAHSTQANEPNLQLTQIVSEEAPEQGCFPAGEPARVLIAEDNPVNRALIEQQMLPYNCHCTIVEDGQQALEQLQNSSFDLLITDLQMPHLDGFDLVRRWRQAEAENPEQQTLTIIALSANADTHTLDRCRATGMNETLFKPLSRSALDQALRRTLVSPRVAA